MDHAQQGRQITGPPSRPNIAVPPSARGGLPAGVEELLVGVVADGFTVYCCGPQTGPTALVACYQWQEWVDLLTVRDFDRVITARVPTQGHRVDIFAPEVVVWAYEGAPQHAVPALLNLIHPTHPDAPTAAYPAPAGLHVPRAQQRPMTIRPPSPSHTRVRAQRLATAMRTHGRHRATALQQPQKIAGWPPVGANGPRRALQAASRSPLPWTRQGWAPALRSPR